MNGSGTAVSHCGREGASNEPWVGASDDYEEEEDVVEETWDRAVLA